MRVTVCNVVIWKRRTWRRAAILAIVTALLTVCSDGSENASTAAGTQSSTATGVGGGDAMPDLSCLGTASPNDYVAGTVDVSFILLDYRTQKATADVSLKACPYTDVDCAAPAAEGVTNPAGTLVLTVPTSERLYIDMTQPSIFPSLWFFDGPYPTYMPIATLSVEAVMTSASSIGSELDPTRGHMVVAFVDCAKKLLPGARLEVSPSDAQTKVFYINEDLEPDPGATETTSVGLAGALNVAAGDIEVTGRLSDGRLISTRTAFVRPATLNLGPGVSPEPEAPP